MTRFMMAALALALVPACGNDEERRPSEQVANTQDEGFARGNALANQAAVELTGDQIAIVLGKTATILAVLNDGEIDQASFAVQVVLAGDIFDFANLLIIDFENANDALDAAVRIEGVPFLPSSSADALAAEFAAGMAVLRATPPGDVDFQFTQLQVINLAEAQVLLDELAVQVGPGALGDFIANTRGLVDVRFAQASDLLATFF